MRIATGIDLFNVYRSARGISLWKSSVNIFSMKETDKLNLVLFYLYSKSVIPDLDTKIRMITLNFSYTF